MQQPFEQLCANIQRANQLRLDRAVDELSPAQVQLIKQLPLLLHFNHVGLPGFVAEQTPQQLSGYTPTVDDLQRLYTQYPEFVAAKHGASQSPAQLLGLFMMGSSGSLGQCCHSDFDLWVCYDPSLEPSRIAELERKCTLLSQWAAIQDLEINFFLVNPEQFRAGSKGSLSKESCGSTHHLLLLDEFYRSWISLGGQYPAWALVPVEQEPHYHEFLDNLQKQGLIRRDEWIDLGTLHQVPAEEYLGAALWQLHKSIESPYKSVLKSLLMEAYSDEYPYTETLAHSIKKNLHAGHVDGLALDGYFLMLEKVSAYLERQNDTERLDLARRSLYLKLCESLSEPTGGQTNWRRRVIAQLVSDWQWSLTKIQQLDHRSQWKIEQVRHSYRELLEALLKSYRNLTRFAQRTGISHTMDQHELSVITRKLYAAFETHEDKVSLVNLRISPDLHESDLSLIQVNQPRGSNQPGWYLYKQPLVAEAILGQSPLEHSPSMIKLLAWSHFNGLLTRFTNLSLHTKGSKMRPKALNQAARDLRETFPVRLPPASHNALSQPSEVRKLALFVNLEDDPTRVLKGHMVEFDVAHQDAFSFGPKQLNLIGSIDVVYTNSWNEIFVTRYQGEQAILQALTELLNKSNQWTSYPQKLNVFCYSKYLGGLIKRCLYQLMADCMEKRLQADNSRLRLHTLRLAGKSWGLIFEPKRVRYHLFDDPVDFYHHLSHTKANSLSMTLDKSGDRAPSVVETYASEGLFQFFFEQTERGFDLFVVDDKNQVETYRNFTGSRDELIQTLNRFYSMAHDRLAGSDSFINFNLPQYYTLYRQNDEYRVQPYVPSRTRVKSKVTSLNTAPPAPAPETAGTKQPAEPAADHTPLSLVRLVGPKQERPLPARANTTPQAKASNQ